MATKLFEIKVSADGKMLCIEVKLPPKVDESSLDALLTQIFQAFDLVDGAPDVRSREQIMESLSHGEADPRRLKLERAYEQPDYPERFERALRRLSALKRVIH